MNSNGFLNNISKIFSPTPIKKMAFESDRSRSVLMFNEGNSFKQESQQPSLIKNPFSLASDTKQIDSCSLEEIEHDMRVMKTKSEEFKSQKELFSIICDSTSPNSIIDDSDNERVERVHNPFEKNFIDDDKSY